MKQIRTNIAVDYASGMGTIENGILTAVLPSFTGTFETMEVNWRYYSGGELVKAGSKMFPTTGSINDVFNAIKPLMTKSFDTDYSGANEEAFYIAFKFEMYQTLLTFNPTLEMTDLIIEDAV